MSFDYGPLVEEHPACVKRHIVLSQGELPKHHENGFVPAGKDGGRYGTLIAPQRF
jgi:hypothetical protein